MTSASHHLERGAGHHLVVCSVLFHLIRSSKTRSRFSRAEHRPVARACDAGLPHALATAHSRRHVADLADRVALGQRGYLQHFDRVEQRVAHDRRDTAAAAQIRRSPRTPPSRRWPPRRRAPAAGDPGRRPALSRHHAGPRRAEVTHEAVEEERTLQLFANTPAEDGDQNSSTDSMTLSPASVSNGLTSTLCSCGRQRAHGQQQDGPDEEDHRDMDDAGHGLARRSGARRARAPNGRSPRERSRTAIRATRDGGVEQRKRGHEAQLELSLIVHGGPAAEAQGPADRELGRDARADGHLGRPPRTSTFARRGNVGRRLENRRHRRSRRRSPPSARRLEGGFPKSDRALTQACCPAWSAAI